MLQWVKPRAAAVKSLRLRGRQDAKSTQLVTYSALRGDKRLHDFTGQVSALQNPFMYGLTDPGRLRSHWARVNFLMAHLLLSRNGVAKLLLTVASPLEELVIECCQDILTDITFIAMSRLPNLTVSDSLVSSPAVSCWTRRPALLQNSATSHVWKRRMIIRRVLEADWPPCVQVLCLKGICTVLSEQDFCAIAKLHHLQELVLDCEQPPEAEEGAEEIKWGLQNFPEGMLHLTNMTHLTLTCHYGITQLPAGLSKLDKLEVSLQRQEQDPPGLPSRAVRQSCA